MQLHSGGFVGGGHAGHLHLGDIGCSGPAISVGSSSWGPHWQSQIGSGHFGQWQTIPSLPLLLAADDTGHNGQSHLGGIMDTSLGFTIATTLDVGKMIAMEMMAAKNVKTFMVAMAYFSFLFEDFTRNALVFYTDFLQMLFMLAVFNSKRVQINVKVDVFTFKSFDSNIHTKHVLNCCAISIFETGVRSQFITQLFHKSAF